MLRFLGIMCLAIVAINVIALLGPVAFLALAVYGAYCVLKKDGTTKTGE